MKNFMNKKALELAINTIVILILAIVLLSVLVLFFTATSGDFIGKIESYFSYSNVDNIIESCNIFADTNAGYSYCCEKRNVKYYKDEKKVGEMFSCLDLNKLKIGNKIKKFSCDNIKC